MDRFLKILWKPTLKLKLNNLIHLRGYFLYIEKIINYAHIFESSKDVETILQKAMEYTNAFLVHRK